MTTSNTFYMLIFNLKFMLKSFMLIFRYHSEPLLFLLKKYLTYNVLWNFQAGGGTVPFRLPNNIVYNLPMWTEAMGYIYYYMQTNVKMMFLHLTVFFNSS